MADTIERLYKLTVDGTSAARALSQIAQSTDSLDRRLAGAINGVMKFGAALGAAFSAGMVVDAIQRNIDAMDELNKAVQKVGIGAEDLQRLRYAADLSGVSAEKLDKAIGNLATGMAELAHGTGETAKALRAIGAQSGDSPVEALKRISDQFAAMPDGLAKTNLAISLFGKKVGPELIPLLNQGGAALQKLADEADRFGGVLSAGSLAAAEQFNDNLSRLQRTISGIVAQITAGMLPALVAISKDLTEAAKTGDGFVSTGEAIGNVLITVYETSLKASTAIQQLSAVFTAWQRLREAPISEHGSIFKVMATEIKALEAEGTARLARFRLGVLEARAAALAPATPDRRTGTDPAAELDRREKALKAATKAAEEHRKAEELRWKELIRATGAEEAANAATDQRAVVLTAQEQAIMEVGKAHKEYLDNIEKEGALQQYLIDLTDESTEAYATASEGLRAYARAQLAAQTVAAQTTAGTIKQSDELKKVDDAFEDFFNSLISGSMTVEQAFKRMAQQIVSDLLKIWARKYIIDAIMRMMGFGGASGGNVTAGPGGGSGFPSSVAMPFSTGPTISPLAAASTFASTAPIRIGGSGSLSLPSQQAAPMKVTVNNYGNDQVTTRQTPDGGLEVLITQVKQSLAADVLRGGTDFARASERAWGLSRGNAAAF
jgi:hypothetical protein